MPGTARPMLPVASPAGGAATRSQSKRFNPAQHITAQLQLFDRNNGLIDKSSRPARIGDLGRTAAEVNRHCARPGACALRTILFFGQPLVAPTVRPRMNCFCSSTYTTTVGAAIRTAPAATRLLSVKNPPSGLPQAVFNEAALPLYGQVANRMLADLRDSAVRKGDKLPSERMLTERYGVSRVTLRSAPNELRQLGILSSAAARGWFVDAVDTRSAVLLPRSRAPQFKDSAASRGLRVEATVLPSRCGRARWKSQRPYASLQVPRCSNCADCVTSTGSSSSANGTGYRSD